VLDGRPGHEKQTLGIIDALSKRTPVKISSIHTGQGTFFSRFQTFVSFLFPFLATTDAELKKGSIVLCTGSKTHIKALFIKKKYNIKAYTCMNPGVIGRSLFDCSFIPVHDKVPAGTKVFLSFGAPNSCTFLDRHEKGRALILVGGVDSSSHYWDSGKIAKMICSVIDDQPENCWTISTSPRTPGSTLEFLKGIAASRRNVTLFDYKDTERGWVEEQYHKNEVVWVTSDSISMLYEAMSAGCQVNIFPMDWKRKKGKFRYNENLLVNKKMVVPFGFSLPSKPTLKKDSTLNEAQRCADYILSTWQKRD